MHMLSYIPTSLLSLLFAWCLLPTAQATYLVVNAPSSGGTWVNGATNPITWTKGLLDDVSTFDIELSRMSTDGLIYIARNVPCATSTGSLNVALQDVPTGDDYYLLFIDSVHGIMYGTSSRFAVAGAANGSAAAPTPAAGAATVTISGGPNPTVGFATTFAATANAAAPVGAAGAVPVMAFASAVVACVLGGAWSVL